MATNRLAALIGSRICHDLISPIGAINNGIELLGMSNAAPPGPEMSLISESVENASARIKFFRVAFGAAGEQQMGRAEVMAILRDLYAGGRLRVAWGPVDPSPRAQVRMCFLALLCLESAMPFGGRIEVSQDNGRWHLQGVADKLNVDEALWALLSCAEVPETLQPAQVQFALLPALARDTDRKVVARNGENEITIVF